MSALYSTRVTANGGRNGTVRSEDGLLDLQLSLPPALGGKGGATNPEQLFAAGYAACFGNAVIHITRNQDAKIRDNDVDVVAQVGMEPNGSGGFALTVALEVTLAGSTRPRPRRSSPRRTRSAPTPMPHAATSRWRCRCVHAETP